MTMSLETVAKSRTYYPAGSRPLSQPVIHGSSVNSKRNIDLSDQKTIEKKCSSSEVSAVSSSGSSSNCRYETSSEGPPQRAELLECTSINVQPSAIENCHLEHFTEASKLGAKVSEAFELIKNDDKKFADIRSFSGIIERSESVPTIAYNRYWDSNDHILRTDDTQDRLVSESSHARIKKLRKIVAYAESSGWSLSDATLSIGNESSDHTTLNTVTEPGTTFNKPNPAVKDVLEVFNKPKGVTFLTHHDDNKGLETQNLKMKGFQQYFPGRCRNSVDPIITCSGEVVDDLIDIANNPNPSIKSIYFPPSPEDSNVQPNFDKVREPKSVRNYPRNRSEIDALSRIEDELGPLQTKFSELAGKFRALNIIGIGSCVDLCLESPGRSTISRDPSGYFLHRTEAFCRNDSVNGFPSSFELPALSTANFSAVVESRGARGSCIWRENGNAEFPRSFHQLRNSVEHSLDENPCCASYENSVQVRNNEVCLVHEKPVGYGIFDFPTGIDSFPGKPEYFVHSTQQEDHSNRQDWKKWKSILPTEHSCHFNSHCQQNLMNNSLNCQQSLANDRENLQQNLSNDRQNCHQNLSNHQQHYHQNMSNDQQRYQQNVSNDRQNCHQNLSTDWQNCHQNLSTDRRNCQHHLPNALHNCQHHSLNDLQNCQHNLLNNSQNWEKNLSNNSQDCHQNLASSFQNWEHDLPNNSHDCQRNLGKHSQNYPQDLSDNSSGPSHYSKTTGSCKTALPPSSGRNYEHKPNRSAENADIHFIDGKISMPFAQNRSGDVPISRRSSCVSRKQSISHKISGGSVATHRVSSIKSRGSSHSTHVSQSVKNRHCSKGKMFSTHITHHEEAQTLHRRHRTKESTSTRYKQKKSQPQQDASQSGDESLRLAERDIFRNLKATQTTDVSLPSPTTIFVHHPDNSESLDIETKTSFITYSQVLKPSETQLEIYTPVVGQQQHPHQMKFTGTYTERTVVRMDSPPDPDAAHSLGLKLGPLTELSTNSAQREESLTKPLGSEADTRNSDHANESHPGLPDSDEKITIHPVMYTSEISESATLLEYDLLSQRRAEVGKKEKRRKQCWKNKPEEDEEGRRHSRTSTRCSDVFSTTSEASESFVSRMTQVAEEQTFLEHQESWFGERRTGSRFSIAYNLDGSRTSICTATSTTSTINTARTLRTEAAASRITISNRSKSLRSRNHSPNNSRVRNLSSPRVRGSRNYSPSNSRVTDLATPRFLGSRNHSPNNSRVADLTSPRFQGSRNHSPNNSRVADFNSARLRVSRNHSPNSSRAGNFSTPRFRRSRNQSPTTSARKGSNVCVIGVRTSPDDFLDDV